MFFVVLWSRREVWEAKSLLFRLTDQGKAFEICLLASGQLGNGLSASMPIGLFAEMVKPAMNVSFTTDPEVESDIVIYISAEYQLTE